MKKPRSEAGLKDMARDFGIPTEPQTGRSYGVSMFDVGEDRGALKFIPRDGVYRVIPADTGYKSTSGLSIGSQATADYTCGRLWKTPRTVDHRVVPETQLPGSMNTQVVGLGLDVRKGGALRRDMSTPAVDE